MESGAKRPLNGVSKFDGQTNTQTHIQTFRLIERIGPEGRFFEKHDILYEQPHTTLHALSSYFFCQCMVCLLYNEILFIPILDTRFSVCLSSYDRVSVRLRRPPLDSETRQTGYFWSKTNTRDFVKNFANYI